MLLLLSIQLLLLLPSTLSHPIPRDRDPGPITTTTASIRNDIVPELDAIHAVFPPEQELEQWAMIDASLKELLGALDTLSEFDSELLYTHSHIDLVKRDDPVVAEMERANVKRQGSEWSRESDEVSTQDLSGEDGDIIWTREPHANDDAEGKQDGDIIWTRNPSDAAAAEKRAWVETPYNAPEGAPYASADGGYYVEEESASNRDIDWQKASGIQGSGKRSKRTIREDTTSLNNDSGIQGTGKINRSSRFDKDAPASCWDCSGKRGVDENKDWKMVRDAEGRSLEPRKEGHWNPKAVEDSPWDRMKRQDIGTDGHFHTAGCIAGVDGE